MCLCMHISYTLCHPPVPPPCKFSTCFKHPWASFHKKNDGIVVSLERLFEGRVPATYSKHLSITFLRNMALNSRDCHEFDIHPTRQHVSYRGSISCCSNNISRTRAGFGVFFCDRENLDENEHSMQYKYSLSDTEVIKRLCWCWKSLYRSTPPHPTPHAHTQLRKSLTCTHTQKIDQESLGEQKNCTNKQQPFTISEMSPCAFYTRLNQRSFDKAFLPSCYFYTLNFFFKSILYQLMFVWMRLFSLSMFNLLFLPKFWLFVPRCSKQRTVWLI